MYPLNDNDLDRLSREAAEHYDVESSATGWEALENRLNRELPHKEDKDRRRFLFWLVFIAAITGGTLFWMLNNNTPSKDSLVQNKGQNNIVSSATTTEDKSGSGNTAAKTNTYPSDNNNIAKKDTKATNAIPQEGSGSTVKPITSNNTTSGKIAGINKSGKTTLASATLINKGKKTSVPVADKTGKDVANQDTNDNQQAANDNKSDAAVTKDKDADQSVANAPVTSDKTTDKIADKTKEDVKPVTEETATPKKAPITSKKSIKGFELGVAFGPDLTNVNFKYSDKAGYIGGLQIGYRFNDRWSVNSGLFYTKKNYKAAGEDFYPPKHYWTTYVNLDKVDGNCSMWEVPLNVRYDFSTGKQQRWFASTGLSTYFMTHQYYEYYYYNQMGVLMKSPGQRKDSTYNHLFSILNLSAGYERSIGKGFSIQAEPYFKVPLKGLGLGELKMESYGILFSLRYRIGQK